MSSRRQRKIENIFISTLIISMILMCILFIIGLIDLLKPETGKVENQVIDLEIINPDKDKISEDYNELIKEDCIDIAVNPVISEYTTTSVKLTDNLLNHQIIYASEMNDIINYFTEKHNDSIFKNQGRAFILAAQETGYDPTFILGMMTLYYGWDETNIEGDFEEKVISHAIWTYNKFYLNDQTNLSSMVNNETNKYAKSEQWAKSIALIMEKSYQIIGGN